MIGNLCPETVEEAKALVPSITVRSAPCLLIAIVCKAICSHGMAAYCGPYSNFGLILPR